MSSSILQNSPTVTATTMNGLPTSTQGPSVPAGAGVTGGYTGNSLDMKITMAFLIGLGVYNALELIVLILVIFNRYRGLYFWSMIVSGLGIMPYSLGFLIKFFNLLDPNTNTGYLAVAMNVVGWYMMVTGQSVVLWSRLHLLTTSRRILRYSLFMICIDVVILGFPTTVLTFGSNASSLRTHSRNHFVMGYNVVEKMQMTLRILRLSKSAHADILSIEDDTELSRPFARKVIYQLLAINVIIIALDIVLIVVGFANIYLIETTLKGVVYSVKLKMEFAILGKLVQIVQSKSSSSDQPGSLERQITCTGLELEKISTAKSARGTVRGSISGRVQTFPDIVDPAWVSSDFTHAPGNMPPVRRPGGRSSIPEQYGNAWEIEGHHKKRWHKAERNNWIDEEMDKHNIG
ncbi:integral membrane protein [Paraphaeosphaeria sporulosa]